MQNGGSVSLLRRGASGGAGRTGTAQAGRFYQTFEPRVPSTFTRCARETGCRTIVPTEACAGEEVHLSVTYAMPPYRRPSRVQVLLFAATFATTFLAGGGALEVAERSFASRRLDLDPFSATNGASYAVAIMAILLAHEMGHYLTCRRYRVPATLPYFIPMPLTIFGTLGAVIRMRGPIYSRRALFDIAVAGPLAGLAVAVPAVVFGLERSQIVEAVLEPGQIYLAEPPLFAWLSSAILGARESGEAILLHPVASAGWAGLFVTALNLLPAGQLDGGHVVYAMMGPRSRLVTLAVTVGLIALTAATGFWSWLVFAALIAAFGFRHPPTIEDGRALERRRFALGLAMIVIFVICFTPVPIILT